MQAGEVVGTEDKKCRLWQRFGANETDDHVHDVRTVRDVATSFLTYSTSLNVERLEVELHR